MTRLFLVALFFGTCICKEVIHFGAFISNIMKDDLCFKAAIDAAVEMINGDKTLLKDYTLKIEYLDNYGMSGFGIKEFFKIRKMKHVLQVLLGPFTEKYAEPIRDLAKGMNLPMFEDNGETHHSQRKAILALLQHYRWKRVSMLYDFGYLHYVKNVRNLKKELREASIQTNSIQGFSSNPYFDVKEQMRKIKNEDNRITILDTNKWAASTIFCDAFLQNMTFPRNVFIAGNIEDMTNDWHSSIHDNTRRCSKEEIMKAAEGFIFLKRSNFQISNGPHFAKKTRKEIWHLIKRYKRQSWRLYVKHQISNKIGGFNIREKVKYNKGSARAFDLVYRVAIAFDGLLKKYGSRKILMNNYENFQKYQLINNAIKEVEFDGISGRQRKISLGHELDHVIYQYRNGTFVDIGYYTPTSNEIKFRPGNSIFKEKVPRDGILLKEVLLTYRTSVLYLMWTVASLGILMSFSLLFLNWQYRNKRIIKMSSPNVNNIIILGCILCYVSIILYGIETPLIKKKYSSFLCIATMSTLSIGFTLLFGGLFSKTWRVYRIFSAARTNSRVAVRDMQLYIIIFSLVSIDVCILASFISFNPFRIEGKKLFKKLYYAEDVMEVTVHRQCNCNNYMVLIIVLIAYKAILLIFGLFMAWETRKVHIPVLNDSKHIGIAVYVVALVSKVGTISATALSSASHLEECYLVVGFSIFLCTTLTLVLVFYSKMTLIFDKSGRDRTQSTSSIISSSSSYPESTVQSSRSLVNVNIKSKTSKWHSFIIGGKSKNDNNKNTLYASSNLLELNNNGSSPSTSKWRSFISRRSENNNKKQLYVSSTFLEVNNKTMSPLTSKWHSFIGGKSNNNNNL